MTQYWFRPKLYGYGATPVTWQGWAVTLAFAAVMIVVAQFALRPLTQGGGVTLWQVALWIAILIAALLGFMRLVRAKTEGEWKWRWGERN
jgi:hypothetical protein